MRKSKVSAGEKASTVQNILAGNESTGHVATRLSVSRSSSRDRITNYPGNGSDTFIQTKIKRYSEELKQQAVSAYMNGEGTLHAICERFGIKNKVRYNNG